MLRSEGFEVDDLGRAAPAPRMHVEDLVSLVGLDPASLAEELPDLADGSERAERFEQQLYGQQPRPVADVVLRLLAKWTSIGGRLRFGSASEPSCFPMADQRPVRDGGVWPAASYPSGKVEVVFPHLRVRAPFDDVALRDEFRRRSNELAGVDLPAAKLDMRPGFSLDVLGSPQALDELIEVMTWFRETALPHRADHPV